MSDTTTGTGEGEANGQGQQQTTAATPADSTPPAHQTATSTDAGTGGGTQQTGVTGQQSADKGDKAPQFTQAELDQIITDRLEKQQKSMQKQFAQAFGIEDPNAEADPAKLYEAQKEATTKAQTRADTAEAKALALQAGVKPERVDRFIKQLGVSDVLGEADRTDSAKVTETLKTAVESELAELPEFKATQVPASSGGDRSGGDSGKPVYTRDQIKKMTREELAEKSDELTQAMAEGRIRG